MSDRASRAGVRPPAMAVLRSTGLPSLAGSPRTLSAIGRPRPTRGLRRLQRVYYRNQPTLLVALPTAIVALVVTFDFFPASFRKGLERFSKAHEVGVSLGEHLLVAALVAAVAYYLLFGLKLQRALKRYRKLSERPEGLVEWSDGKPLLVRRRRAELFAEAVARSPEPAVAVVQGRTGTGRTSFVVGLVAELAEQKLIPIPLQASKDGSFDVAIDAKQVFCDRIDRKVSSDQQADAIWRRARASRGVVILVDGIDDEFVDKLSEDGGARFRKAIAFLREQRIAVVLATTRKLPLDGIALTVREDLDLFTREEAEAYIEKLNSRESTGDSTGVEHVDEAKVDEAKEAIRRLHDPVDESLVAPFYLELIAALDRPLGSLSEDRDRWRAEVLERYLAGVSEGVVAPRQSNDGSDVKELADRGKAAKRAAAAVALKLDVEHGQLSVTAEHLDAHALEQAVDFGLLWHGDKQVGFAADDLGAYVVGGALKDAGALLKGIEHIAIREYEHRRRDRFVTMAMIFWHFQQDAPGRHAGFQRLLGEIDRQRWTRPAVVAAAVRIASVCKLDGYSSTLRNCVSRCIDAAEALEENDTRAWQRGEMIKVVRALAGWPDAMSHELLWRLATSHDVDLEWPSAKALAVAPDQPASTLRAEIERKLGEASSRTPRSMSRPDDRLGNEIASLAWILPTLREHAESQFEHVKELCLDAEMSPLRGEMSLAQGLKLAMVNRRARERNADDVVDLLLRTRGPDREPFVRFWHARLVLVQALLARVWDEESENNADALGQVDDLLKELQRTESHPLVSRAIRLSREGLKALERSPRDGPPRARYMWVHEREAVKWVGRDKADVARLAADTVLLSNLTYEARKADEAAADRAVALGGLPSCIHIASHRQKIDKGGCNCEHRLCDPPKSPVTNRRARFSEGFCREQVRLVELHGPPPWTIHRTRRSRRKLEEFWRAQASFAAGGNRSDQLLSATDDDWLPPRQRADEAYIRTLADWWRTRER